jgi:hypothetical protein
MLLGVESNLDVPQIVLRPTPAVLYLWPRASWVANGEDFDSFAAGLPFIGGDFSMDSNVLVLAQASGTWSVGTELSGVELNPEKLSPFYRTRCDITYPSGTLTGTIAVNDLVTGSTPGWSARVVSHNTGAKTMQLSLYSGTAPSTGETITGPSGNVTLCSFGLSAGVITGYSDASGKKAPRCTPLRTGYYNCIGVAQDTAFGATKYRFPLQPEYYSESFEVPEGTGDGDEIEIRMTGIFLNTTPDSNILVFTLNIGETIFVTTALDANNHRARVRLESPVFPAVAAETPFTASIKLSTSRKIDHTQGNIVSLLFETNQADFPPVGTYRAMKQRGTDVAGDVAGNFTGFLFEGGDDQVNKVSKRKVAVWMAQAPLVPGAAGSDGVATSGAFYVNVHTFQARRVRDARRAI